MRRAVIINDDGYRVGHIDIPDPDPVRSHDAQASAVSGCALLLMILLPALAVGIVLTIEATTGINVFDYFEGITGPCAGCTP